MRLAFSAVCICTDSDSLTSDLHLDRHSHAKEIACDQENRRSVLLVRRRLRQTASSGMLDPSQSGSRVIAILPKFRRERGATLPGGRALSFAPSRGEPTQP